jgi:hypothetical protein
MGEETKRRRDSVKAKKKSLAEFRRGKPRSYAEKDLKDLHDLHGLLPKNPL